MAVPPEETVTGLVPKLVVGPDGEELAERVIVPAKLFMLDIVMVLLAFVPWDIDRLVGFAPIPKSGTGGFWTMKSPCM